MSSPNRRRSLLLGAAGLCLAVVGCGFVPIAATEGFGDAATRPKLSSLRVNSPETRFEYYLRRRVLQFVDVGVAGAPSLETRTTLNRTGLAIDSDDAITRFTIRTETAYRLNDSDRKAITSGVASSATSLNATANQFTTEISERDALRRIAEDTADRLVNVLRLHHTPTK